MSTEADVERSRRLLEPERTVVACEFSVALGFKEEPVCPETAYPRLITKEIEAADEKGHTFQPSWAVPRLLVHPAQLRRGLLG